MTPMKKIFLSASIPARDRDAKYYDSADMDAITNAVKALARVIVPRTHLVWGGHPAITPLIRSELSRLHADLKLHVTLYQSEYFREKFPEDNSGFEDVVVIPKEKTKEGSLENMRRHMIGDHEYVAGIFIGGMDGVKEEYELFKSAHPEAAVLPLASTGAAAKFIYDELKEAHKEPLRRLETDHTYMPLFNDIFEKYIEPVH